MTEHIVKACPRCSQPLEIKVNRAMAVVDAAKALASGPDSAGWERLYAAIEQQQKRITE